MCSVVLPAWMSLYHVGAWCPSRPEEIMGFPGTRVQTVVSCCPNAGTHPRSSGRVSSVLHHWTISLALLHLWLPEMQVVLGTKYLSDLFFVCQLQPLFQLFCLNSWTLSLKGFLTEFSSPSSYWKLNDHWITCDKTIMLCAICSKDTIANLFRKLKGISRDTKYHSAWALAKDALLDQTWVRLLSLFLGSSVYFLMKSHLITSSC